MATVQGIREKVHLPIYDSIFVKPEEQLRKITNGGSTIKFFVDVQHKNKLETNLQSASLLPHYNTFEGRAMRVVISDLPPEFPDDENAPTVSDEDQPVTGTNTSVTPAKEDQQLYLSVGDSTGTVSFTGPAAGTTIIKPITADFEITLARAMELLRQARESDDRTAELPLDDDDVTLNAGSGWELDDTQKKAAAKAGDPLSFTVRELEDYILDTDQIPERQQPPLMQIRPNNGAGNIISKLIFNTVTTLYIGEKEMITGPTFFWPGGAGPYSLSSNMISHGEPTPLATFRFAEPVYVDRLQNFRVEMEIPDSDVFKEVQKIYGPLFVWIVLDGYMTRDVQ